jgi:GWxTD domain-containing protein
VADSTGKEEILKAREFGVRSTNYPEVKNVYELREPLVYLMNEKEYKALMELTDPVEIKKAIDFFWLSKVGRTNKAKNVISMYYERVEQANRLFGSWKEGWKTDMGMVYILFGPPWYVDRNVNAMVWSYTYNRNDPELNFIFDRILPGQPYYPFTNYIFRRNRGYYQIEYNQVDIWLSGLVLQGR